MNDVNIAQDLLNYKITSLPQKRGYTIRKLLMSEL